MLASSDANAAPRSRKAESKSVGGSPPDEQNSSTSGRPVTRSALLKVRSPVSTSATTCGAGSPASRGRAPGDARPDGSARSPTGALLEIVLYAAQQLIDAARGNLTGKKIAVESVDMVAITARVGYMPGIAREAEAGHPMITAATDLGLEAAHVEVRTLLFIAPAFRILEQRDVIDEVLDALAYHICAQPDIGVRDDEDRTGTPHLDEFIGARAVAATQLVDVALGAGGLRNADHLERERRATCIRLTRRRERLQQDECEVP